MSVHTIIQSRITDARALGELLNELNVPWREVDRYSKRGGGRSYCSVEVQLGGETVYMDQLGPGQPFRLQSAGWRFRDRSSANMLAGLGSAGEVRARRGEAARREEERLRIEAQRRAAEVEARRRAAAEAEHQRLAEEEARRRAVVEAERQRVADEEAEKERLADLDDEVERLMAEHAAERRAQRARLLAEQAEQEAAKQAKEAEAAAAEDAVEPSPPGEEATAALGRLHQLAAEKKVLAALDDLRDKFGLMLDTDAERRDDGTLAVQLRR